jgi:hypothetical protein
MRTERKASLVQDGGAPGGTGLVPMAVVHREEEWAHRPDKP